MTYLIRRCFLFLFCTLVCQAQTSPPSFAQRLVQAALERTQHTVRYESDYVKLDYPNGDVPADTGVCTDEIIRSYRALGIDLQKLVHEDMQRAFATYPKDWGLRTTDKNMPPR
jgi:uncharacterized protein YijF (DUF1287 family)